MLRSTSCQAQVAESFCKALTEYMARKLEVSAEFVGDIPWQLREPMFDRGEIHVCWMCGLPNVRKRDARQVNAELVAAPVMRDARYGGRPVYFSDVVVHTESTFSSFDDLRGATWAYNEPGSHSGYNMVRYHLATRDWTASISVVLWNRVLIRNLFG